MVSGVLQGVFLIGQLQKNLGLRGRTHLLTLKEGVATCCMYIEQSPSKSH